MPNLKPRFELVTPLMSMGAIIGALGAGVPGAIIGGFVGRLMDEEYRKARSGYYRY